MNPEQPINPILSPTRNFKILAMVGLAVAAALAAVCVWLFLAKSSAASDLDTKIAAAVTQAETDLTAQLDQTYQEVAKSPFRTLTFAESLGGVTLAVPKSWSVYAANTGSGSMPLDVFAHPDYVPSEQAKISYAFRLQITSQEYSLAIKKYDSLAQRGTVIARPTQSNGVLGATFTGAISTNIDGTLSIFPLRDKTILLWTESNSSYGNDFNQILSSLTFTP